MRKNFLVYVPLLAIALLALLLDQLSKNWVRQHLQIGRALNQEGWAHIVHVGNSGAAGGILVNANTFFTLIALMVCLAILFLYPRLEGRGVLMRLALALLLGGSLGNLIDRLMQGYVTDIIALGSLPVFNLADVWVLAGAILLALALA